MQIKRNAYMRLRFGQPPELDLLLEGRTLEVRDRRVLHAIVFSEKAMGCEALEQCLRQSCGQVEGSLEGLLSELLAAQILVPADYRHPLQDAAEHWQRRGWLDALVLHLQSRDLVYSDFGSGAFVSERAKGVARRTHEWADRSTEQTAAGAESIGLPPPPPHWSNRLDVLDVMRARRSGAPWTNQPIDKPLLASLLADGNRDALRNRRLARDARGPTDLCDCSSYTALETYVVCNRVQGVDPGVYQYAVESHQLTPLRSGEFQQELVTLCIGQAKVRGCSVAFLITACWARYYDLYRHARAYRNLLINTAELAHCYILAATAASLSNFITPAFNDEVAEQLVGSSSLEQGPLYLVAVG